jgi:hypothetical protein
MRLTRLFLVPIALAGLGGTCDPVHEDAIAALGDEAPGVRKGPLHRAGQPCLLCHDGAIGDPAKFSVAGTVYVNQNSLLPAENATVTLTSFDGSPPYTTTTNAAGNFYVEPSQYTAAYPMKVSVTYRNVLVKMNSDVGREGSCAACHTDPAGPTSAGHIYVPPNGVAP